MHTTLRSSHLNQHVTSWPKFQGYLVWTSCRNTCNYKTKSSIQHLGQVRIQLFLSCLSRSQRASSAAVCRNFPEIWVWRAENVIQPLLSSLSLLSLPLLLLHSRLNETLSADDAQSHNPLPLPGPGLIHSFIHRKPIGCGRGRDGLFFFFFYSFPSTDRY